MIRNHDKEEYMKLSSFRFHDQDQVEGTRAPADREVARREERLRLAMKSAWSEIPRSRLEIGRHLITDTATNELYTVLRGEVDGLHSPVAAYFVSADGSVVFLEHYVGARTVEALAAKRAAHEEARAERLRPRVRR